MPDDMDLVQKQTAEFIAYSLAEHMRKTPEVSKTSEVCIDCIDCNNEIPTARLAVQPNAERCVSCQEIYAPRRPL